MLFATICVYLPLSHVFRQYFVPVSPLKSPLQPLYRAYFFLAFSVIYLYVMSGNSLFKIGAILGINYAIAKIGGSARWMPIATWIFNVAILFANEKYEGYAFAQLHPALSWMVRRCTASVYLQTSHESESQADILCSLAYPGLKHRNERSLGCHLQIHHASSGFFQPGLLLVFEAVSRLQLCKPNQYQRWSGLNSCNRQTNRHPTIAVEGGARFVFIGGQGASQSVMLC